MNKELLKKYINYFGDKPPFPPKHIMESLVRMKDDGTFEEKLKVVSSFSNEFLKMNSQYLNTEIFFFENIYLKKCLVFNIY